MPDRVINAYLRTTADRKARLIDFETGKVILRDEHTTWLDGALAFISRTTWFYVDIIGYASNLGNADANIKLSEKRAGEVAAYLQRRNSLVYARIRYYQGRGSRGGGNDPNDDADDMRAVEVHIYIGDIEPPPPPESDPRPRTLPPLPGAPRTSKWSVAAPGGGTGMIFPGVTIGFNIFFVRNEDSHEIRGYIVPAGGVGYSYSGPAKGAYLIIKQILTTLVGSPSFTDLSYADAKPSVPFNWEELENSLVTVSSAGGGLIRGLAAAHVTFESQVTHYDSTGSGASIREAKQLFTLDSAGKDWQFGVGASAIAGPLVKIGTA